MTSSVSRWRYPEAHRRIGNVARRRSYEVEGCAVRDEAVVREGRIELPTSTLSRWHSTTELLPRGFHRTEMSIPDEGTRRLSAEPEGCQIVPPLPIRTSADKPPLR